MTTFSQLVDEMVLETKRPDLRTEIASYLNQTIRELHFDPETNASICYAQNATELQVTADSDEAFYWDIPNIATFQKMEGVQLAEQYDHDGEKIWLTEVVPNRGLRGRIRYYYRGANRFVFAGYGGDGAVINLFYFEYPSRLKYYASADRPASYDPVDGFTYHDDYTTDEEHVTAENLSTNWLLLRWKEIIEEGLRAKIYKRVSDESRARLSYSMYTSLRKGLYTAEVSQSNGAW